MSGAQIAEKLVLSPETVRTHVRNAMAKLGASTRSQAVALALQQREITADPEGAALRDPARPAPPADSEPTGRGPERDARRPRLALRRRRRRRLPGRRGRARAASGSPPPSRRPTRLELPEEVALGEGTLGRAALERRAQLVRGARGEGSGRGALIAAPMIGDGRLLGVIALAARVSRPIGRSEMLLLQAFANRVGEILLAGGDVGRRLDRAMQRFQASWSGAPAGRLSAAPGSRRRAQI